MFKQRIPTQQSNTYLTIADVINSLFFVFSDCWQCLTTANFRCHPNFLPWVQGYGRQCILRGSLEVKKPPHTTPWQTELEKNTKQSKKQSWKILWHSRKYPQQVVGISDSAVGFFNYASGMLQFYLTGFFNSVCQSRGPILTTSRLSHNIHIGPYMSSLSLKLERRA